MKVPNILYALNDTDILKTHVEFKESERMIGLMKNSCAWFCSSDGQGRLTPAVSTCLAEFVNEVIDDNSKVPGMASKFADLSEHTISPRLGGGKSSRQFWKTRGSLVGKVKVIYRGKHTRTVGIGKESTMSKGGWGTPNQIVKASVIANYLELGWISNDTYIEGRPLFKYATEYFIYKYFPKWSFAVENALRNIYKDLISARRKDSVTSRQRKSKAEPTIALSQHTLSAMKDDSGGGYTDEMIISDLSRSGQSFGVGALRKREQTYSNDKKMNDKFIQQIKKDVGSEAAKWLADNPDWENY